MKTRAIVLASLIATFAWANAEDPPAATTEPIDLAALVADLDAREFRTRQAAEGRLRNVPADRVAELEALVDPTNPEQRIRILNAIHYIQDHGPLGIRTLTENALDPTRTAAERKSAFRGLALLINEGNTSAVAALSTLSTQLSRSNDRNAARMRVENMNNMRDAFTLLGNAAGADNKHALTALIVFAKVNTLRSYAPNALGQAAAKGSTKALEVLTSPSEYGLNASSTILALQPAIAQNNAAAIKALQAMVEKPGNGGLHYLIATALQAAAAQNNPSAVETLGYIAEHNTSSSTLRRALDGLRLASKRGNEKATSLMETYQPKYEALLKGGIRAKSSTTIRVIPNKK